MRTKLECWCSHVLPTVYDESLSYYELLCKVADSLNSVIDDVDRIAEFVNGLEEDLNTLVEGVVVEKVEEVIESLSVVLSVNGKTGAVQLTAADVGALPNSVTKLPSPGKLIFGGAISGEYDGSTDVSVVIPSGGGGAVDSVNGYAGAVTLDADDVGAVPAEGWGAENNGKFLKIDSNGDVVPVAGSGDVVVAGVSSVNGMSGDVTISELPSPGTLTFSGGATGSYDGSEDVVVNVPTVPEIPSSLPNPNALNFTGGVAASYDGSETVSVAIPTKLPTPNALTFSGAVTGSYDGSAPVNINIPSGGASEDAIQFIGAIQVLTTPSQGAGTVNIPLGAWRPTRNDLYVIEYQAYNNTAYGSSPYTAVVRASGLYGNRNSIALTAIHIDEYGAAHALYREVSIIRGADNASLDLTYGVGYKASIGQSGAAAANNTAIGINTIAVYGTVVV